MLGKFLEISVPTSSILESWQFYLRLGFTAATTADVWPHGYAALTDGRITVGLHDADAAATALTWVHPGLAAQVTRLQALGLEFETLALGEDRFNEADFLDPDGHRVRLLEARTFSPPERPAASLLGWFDECALAVDDLELARAFWERLGFVTAGEGEVPWPHLELTSDHLDLGLYRTREVAAPTLVFEHDDPARLRESLAALGVEPERRLPRGLDARRDVLLVAPEGTRLLVLATRA